MGKEKIAISLSRGILKQIDSRVDGLAVRSRSQAVEMLVKKGMESRTVGTAVLMVSRDHQKIALSGFKGSSLLGCQIKFFREFGIENIYIVTQPNGDIIKKEASKHNAHVEETAKKENAEALKSMKGKLKSDFIVMSGDTYNYFDLGKMIEKHTQKNVIATMGLMSHEKPGKYGSAILDGDMVVNFREKSKISHIINAGIYIFKEEVFDTMSDCKSLEFDLFPKLAKMRQLAGYFTMGEYCHVSENARQHS